MPNPPADSPSSLALRRDTFRARVEAGGGRISSICVGTNAGAVELMMRTPWADDVDKGLALRESADEWHRRYPGGWHLLLPRPLGPATVDGIEQPYHGEAAWRRWNLVSRGDDTCALSVTLRTVPLHIERLVQLESADGVSRVSVTTTVTNLGARQVSFGWAEHPTFPGTLFAGGNVTVGDRTVRIVERDSGQFDDLDNTTGFAAMTSPSTGLEIRLDWNAALLPRTYVWQERGSIHGFPWHGVVDAVAVEPASQRHDHPANELGEIVLESRATRRTKVTLTVRDRG